MNLQASIDLNCVVVKEGGQYCVKSEDRSKNLGCKNSKAGAKKRLQQVDYFKNLKGGGQGSGRKKDSNKKKWSQMSEEERREVARQMTFPSVDISKYGLDEKDIGHKVDHGARKTGITDPVAKLERIGRR